MAARGEGSWVRAAGRLAVAAAWVGSAEALAQEDVISFEATTTVEHGVDTPKLTFHPRVGGTMQATLRCPTKTFTLDTKMAAGQPIVLALTGLPEGVHACEAAVALRTSDGTTGDMGFALTVASLKQLQLGATIDDYDRVNGALVVHADRDVVDARATLYGPRGVVIGSATADLTDPRTPKLRWGAVGQEVVKVEVEAQDANGFRTVLEVLPWFYAIPHEDVVFESGQDLVREGEQAKLERSWAEVVKAMELYGSVMEIRLYVAGYTDTVADAGSNLALSERRARSIAAWFRARGFRGPVLYQGFGEAALAVQTADGVDEPANRRALYVLAANTPPTSPDLPRSDWKRL